MRPNRKADLQKIISTHEIKFFQQLIRKIPVAENVMNYAVTLARKTRPTEKEAPQIINDYVSWGAGPRASQFLVLGAKCHAAINGKYSPDIEDVKAIATAVLRHRIIRNYKAEAENISVEDLVAKIL